MRTAPRTQLSASSSNLTLLCSSALTATPALFAPIQSPSSFQIIAFSAGVVFAARPLVDVATNVLAPGQRTLPFLSTSLPSQKLSSCHPYWKSLFACFLAPFLTLTLTIVSQIPFPTMQTTSDRYALTFSSKTGTQASSSSLLRPAPSRVGRRHRFVLPMLYRSIKSCVSLGR